MSYNYQNERPHVFTPAGQILFLKIRDRTKTLLAEAGCARSDKMMAGCSGVSWHMLACIDRLVELGEIREIPNPISSAGQHRIFVGSSL